jgi:hypothetical protein
LYSWILFGDNPEGMAQFYYHKYSVPTLSYDAATAQVRFANPVDGTAIVCATIKKSHKKYVSVPTGHCVVEIRKIVRTYDDGLNQTQEPVDEVIFTVRK